LKIEVCGTTWTYNPLAVTKLDSLKNKKMLNSTDLNEGIIYFDPFKNFAINYHIVFFLFSKELVKAAANGDEEKCEYILSIPGSNVIV
jgi:E3 ubiquitin-protein ligase mind-bomb